MYGLVSAMLRSVGVLNAPKSDAFFVCVYLQASARFPWVSAPTPMLWNLLSVKSAYFFPITWHTLQLPFFRLRNNFRPRCADRESAFWSPPYLKRSNGKSQITTVR